MRNGLIEFKQVNALVFLGKFEHEFEGLVKVSSDLEDFGAVNHGLRQFAISDFA